MERGREKQHVDDEANFRSRGQGGLTGYTVNRVKTAASEMSPRRRCLTFDAQSVAKCYVSPPPAPSATASAAP